MNCEEIKEKCKFCGREIKLRKYHDPIHYIYDCDNCGKYILLEEIYNYIYFRQFDFSIYENKLKSIADTLKPQNKNNFSDDVIFAIGNHDDIEKFKISDIVVKQHQGINWQFVSYTDLLKNDDIVELKK